MKHAISKLEYRDGAMCIELKTRCDARKICNELGEKINAGRKYDVEITQHREKRSRDANSYCWALLGKLSEVLHIPTKEIYREMIQNIGNNFVILDMETAAVESFCKSWEHNGIGWMAVPTGSSRTDGHENVIAYYGSSTYDTKQMSRLIDLIVQECREQGIETMPPSKLAFLKEQWDERENKGSGNKSRG